MTIGRLRRASAARRSWMAFLTASAETWGGSPSTLLDPLQSKLMEEGLHHRVRAFQCKFWMSGSDISWSTLAEYLKVAEQCEQPKKRLAPDAGVGLLADSDRELDAGESQCSLLFDDDE